MRRCFHENVLTIIEELQGSAVAPQQQGQPGAMPTPGLKLKPKIVKGNPAQQVAAGVQGAQQQAVQQAGQQSAQGDQQIRHDMAQQQGIDPNQQQQVNKNLAAQPKPAKTTTTAQARGVQGDAMDNRRAGITGKPVQGTDEALDGMIDKAVSEAEEVDTKPAGDAELSNPDDKEGVNDNPAQARADQRAKEVFTKASGDKPDFPGDKKDLKAAGYGKKGAGRPQNHHEVTNARQVVTKEKGVKANEEETVFSDADRAKLLDEVFKA